MEPSGNRLLGEDTTDTKLHASHKTGPVVRVRSDRCTIENVSIGSTGSRLSHETAGTNFGIHVEARDRLKPDGSPEVATQTRIMNVNISNQPSHGVLLCCGFLAATIENIGVSCCKGHGIAIDDGSVSGRTNRSRAGGEDISVGVIAKNGGHGIKLGTDGGSSAYRVRGSWRRLSQMSSRDEVRRVWPSPACTQTAAPPPCRPPCGRCGSPRWRCGGLLCRGARAARDRGAGWRVCR